MAPSQRTCKHGRVTVINVVGDVEQIRRFLERREDPGYIFWMEQCNHCDLKILSRARRDELPDRVNHYIRTHRRPSLV